MATPTPLGWAGHPLAFIVKVESAGSHVMHKIVCVCEWGVTKGWGVTFVALFALSRSTIVLQAEEIFCEALSDLISILSKSHDYCWMFVGKFIISL